MSIYIDLRFPHRFSCEVLDDLPGGPHKLFHFPRDRAAGQDGVVVRVHSELTTSWIGMFAFGKFGNAGVSRLVGMPDQDTLCVVSRGAGYVVSAANPEVWETPPAVPIIDVQAIPGPGLVIFANYTEILAYGSEGLRWRTKRLAWDGLKILSVSDRAVVGEYYDIRDETTRQFEVDLVSGIARGGVES